MDNRERISKLVQAQWKLEHAKELILSVKQDGSADHLVREIDSAWQELDALILSLNYTHTHIQGITDENQDQ
jgi:quinolinate synthase